ncbi:unnamed protein product [Xylocopa violacea]|uniref:Uncharacterized protein n=1 Tax=Xylocopa violacea TaxID=135666 RepID=A0ABP1NC86_XYLVO
MEVDSHKGVSPASCLTVREGVSLFIERNTLAKADSQPGDVRPAAADFDLEALASKIAEIVEQKLTIFKNKLNFTPGEAYSAPQTIPEDDTGKKSTQLPQPPRRSPSSALTLKRANKEESKKKKKKKKIKRILPSSSAIEAASHTPTENEGSWAANKISVHVHPRKGDGKAAGKKVKSKRKERVPLPKSPRMSAVVITIPPGCNKTYCEVMTRARERIHLEDIGIDQVRPRRVKTGGLLLELTSPDREKKADRLAYCLKKVLHKIGVQVYRPMKRVELRVRDLEESVEPWEVEFEISEQGRCSAGIR